MGIGMASGDKGPKKRRGWQSVLLFDVSINGAKEFVFHCRGDLTMFEIQDAARIITESIGPNAKVIFGTIYDDKQERSNNGNCFRFTEMPGAVKVYLVPSRWRPRRKKGKIYNANER